jgi:hypothetical protein
MGFISNLQALNNDAHKSGFNGHKKMYYINNIMGHNGLFIYFDTGYLGSFHVMNIMCESNLYKNSCWFKLYVGMNTLIIYGGTQVIWAAKCNTHIMTLIQTIYGKDKCNTYMTI